jgi:putative resolvase
VNLSDWADRVGVSKHTAYRWYREGTLPVPSRRAGRLILVDVADGGGSVTAAAGRTVLYARVSSHDESSDLERQVARMTAWATAQGLPVDEVVTEVASAISAKRKKLQRVLSDPSVANVIVERRDRLARFGVEYLEAALSAQGRRVLVVDPGEVNGDLVRDMTDVLTSFCARLYGRAGARNRAIKALGCARNDVGPAACKGAESSC